MSANRFKPHVFILPEDDANRQIANGFVVSFDIKQIQILPVAGGWRNVCNIFLSDHVSQMERFNLRRMILLIDFDGEISRYDYVKGLIPQGLEDRVFVLGARNDPESLRRSGLGTFETIGSRIADDCINGTQTIWTDSLLLHNEREIERLRSVICPMLT
ncbi:MAG: hypothetical protein OEL53_16160 [Rhodospirillales bacterium]|nr:hypothetical protein [Rhodospirillales bacterium]